MDAPSESTTNFVHHFGIENIPFGIASSRLHPAPACVTRHANSVIFLADLPELSSRLKVDERFFLQPTLNAFAALGRGAQHKARGILQEMIEADSLPQESCEDVADVQMHLPVSIGDFTDFSCSPHHNRNAGQALLGMSRGLPPGYSHLPLGYAGRCSSIEVSGVPIRRPRGQFFEHGKLGLQGKRTEVIYGPCRDFDYELELGVVVGQPVPRGQWVNATEAAQHIFGFVLLNDWSARDVQQLEMIPVGPLCSKHAGTTISPWIITPEALAPHALPAKAKEHILAPHLNHDNGTTFAIEVQVSVDNQTIGRTTLDVMDWTFDQLIAHQASSGCGLRTGDLLGIGTISGPGPDEHGCLLEKFAEGQTPRRGYLEDGEEVQMTGFCGQGVGFGECKAKVLPALDDREWRSGS